MIFLNMMYDLTIYGIKKNTVFTCINETQLLRIVITQSLYLGITG